MSEAAVANAGFEFVQRLADDLNRGDLKLPSFPDVVMRIKRSLEQPNCTAGKLARIVATEPALAARLLNVANSALMARGANPVNDIRTAVSRLGYETVHTTAVSVAVEQIFIGASLGDHRERLRAIWHDAAHIAATCYTLARRLTKYNPDEALLAGLLHNVGKLYIVMHASEYQEFFDSDEALDEVITQWHGQVGRAILESWGFGDDKAAAAADHMDLDRGVMGPPDLTDIVTVAWLINQQAASEDFSTAGVRACSRLRLDEDNLGTIIGESKANIESLARALSG